MSDDHEPNVCQLMAGMVNLQEAILNDISPISAMREIRDGLEKVQDNRAFNGIPKKVDQVNELLAHGHTDQARPLVEKLVATVGRDMPRFRIVLINETRHWNDKKLVQAAGEIWAAYLYDENRKVHMADIRPSYEMTHLYDTSKNTLSDLQQEQLLSEGGEPISMYCQDVDATSWSRKHFCGNPVDPAADDYTALEASEVEYYAANICIDLPRSLDVSHVLLAARQQLRGSDDLGAIATLKMLAASEEIGEHKEEMLKIVTQYQRTSMTGDLLTGLDSLNERLLAHSDAEDPEEAEKQ